MLRAISQSHNPLKLITHRLPPLFSSSLRSLPYSSKQKREDDQDDPGSPTNRDPTSPPRLFVVQPRLRPDNFQQAKLNEALCLANSLEEQRDGYFHTDFFDKGLPPHVVVQNPAIRSPKPRADTYFGPGTVDTIKCHLYNAESKGEVDAVFVNAILSGIQQRNLERAWGKPVLDRVGLIIEIFNAHAFTKEAKLQAELAALMYKKTRLVRVRGPDGRLTFGTFGEAEVVSARGRASGGRGFISGAGETELQLQRRRILERRNHLLTEIEEVRRTRALQRESRKRHGGSYGQRLATVAVVGYTNAGKSTLVSALSGSNLYSDDRLFATVDPRLRSVVLPSGRKVLLSDTVGFISDLPVQLVEAFHATLEEVVEADLLVHVIDCTAPNLDEHRSTVLQVLEQIGVSQEKIQNMIEVWNKIDYQDEETGENLFSDHGEHISLSGEDDDYTNSLLGSKDNDCAVKGSPGMAEDDGERENEGNEIVSELAPEDVEWTMDSGPEDIYNSWLQAGDTQKSVDNYEDSSMESKTRDDLQSKPHQDGEIRNDSRSEASCSPHVKTSAVTGVGLQELLELIDERLKTQDEKLKDQRVLERSVFDRKWRPARTEDAKIAV